MAMPDTDRPREEGEPEDFDDRDPFDDEFDGDDHEPREQLALGDDDVSLPWLEGDDDFEDERGGGGQVLLLALMALGALALIIGGIWWFTRDNGESDMVADGSVIEAPAQPYKEKPENPGGKTFEGTGDTSYAVSEGETRPARLGENDEMPKPGFETVAPASEAAKPSAVAPKPSASAAATQPAPAAAPSGPAVQIGAYSSRASAEEAWGRLSGSYSALSGQRHRVVEGRADIGTVYRLQVLPGDGAAARSLCGNLKSAGLDCAVKD